MQEAGGLATGSKHAFSTTADGASFGEVTEDILTGRKYIVVRAIADTPVSKLFSIFLSVTAILIVTRRARRGEMLSVESLKNSMRR